MTDDELETKEAEEQEERLAGQAISWCLERYMAAPTPAHIQREKVLVRRLGAVMGEVFDLALAYGVPISSVTDELQAWLDREAPPLVS